MADFITLPWSVRRSPSGCVVLEVIGRDDIFGLCVSPDDADELARQLRYHAAKMRDVAQIVPNGLAAAEDALRDRSSTADDWESRTPNR